MNHEKHESISRQLFNYLIILLLIAIFATAAVKPEFIGSMAGKIVHAYKTQILNQ